MGQSCDQIYIIDTNNYNLDKEVPHMVSLGLGRTTCSYFMPGDSMNNLRINSFRRCKVSTCS